MAKKQNYSELSVKELNEKLLELRQEQFNLRMQKATGNESPNNIKQVRRDIARVKTQITIQKGASENG